MKKIYLILKILASFLFLSCASASFSINDFESVAVIGVSGNKNLSEQVDSLYVRSDEEDIDDTNPLSVLVDKFLHKENPELLTAQDRVDYAEEYLRHALEELAGLRVSEKASVINSDEYQNAKKNPLSTLNTWISATDFDKNLYSIGSKKARILMNELGVKSLVAAEFRFNKVFADSSKVKTNVRAQVIMEVLVYNEKGRQVAMNTFEATSNESLPVRKFEYDTDTLLEMYPEVIETVVNKFIMAYLD